MWNTKLGFATLALGSFLTLLGPTAASARDRDDYRQNDDRGYTSGYTNSFRNRNNEREIARLRQERERFEQQQRNRDRRYTNSYSNQNSYRESGGYYDNSGCWHSF
jgi:hypothetical protein